MKTFIPVALLLLSGCATAPYHTLTSDSKGVLVDTRAIGIQAPYVVWKCTYKLNSGDKFSRTEIASVCAPYSVQG